MKNRTILTIAVFIFSCDSEVKIKEYPSLPKYIQTHNRSCYSDEAEKFSNVDNMLADLYAHSHYKDSFELNLRLGTFYYYRKSFDTALVYDLKAREINPSEPKIHFDIALTYCELSQWENALNSINAALSVCGDKWEYLNSKCYILSNLDSCEQSIKVGLISYRMQPENKKIYGNLLDCFDKLGQRDSIIKFIDLATQKFNLSNDIVAELKQKYHYRGD